MSRSRGISSEPDILSDIRDTLPGLLSAAAASSERAIIDLEVSAAEDRRASRALEETGLLPPARDVERVFTELRGAGINCVPGWRYLNQAVSADLRSELITREPAFAGGVILNHVDDIDQARAILADADLRPVTLVCVSASDYLRGDAGTLVVTEPDKRPVVVQPNRALFDDSAGEANE